jgi:hypothetical protein
VSEIVAPACAVADIAVSGNKSESVRRLFFNMVRRHHLFEERDCASNGEMEQILWRSQTHADVMSDTSDYQRNSRGPNMAPARVHRTIVPPYQTAMNGNESSVQ